MPLCRKRIIIAISWTHYLILHDTSWRTDWRSWYAFKWGFEPRNIFYRKCYCPFNDAHLLNASVKQKWLTKTYSCKCSNISVCSVSYLFKGFHWFTYTIAQSNTVTQTKLQYKVWELFQIHDTQRGLLNTVYIKNSPNNTVWNTLPFTQLIF